MNGSWKRHGAVAGLLLFVCALELGSESVSLTTYYPAPSGVYAKLIATSHSYLARDGGKVGIGTSSPVEKLHILGSAAALQYRVGLSGVNTVYIATAADTNDFGLFTASTQRAVITAAGRVGLGNTSPSTQNFLLDVGVNADASAMRIRKPECGVYRFLGNPADTGDETCATAAYLGAGPECNSATKCYVTTVAGVMSEFATPGHEILVGDINPSGGGNMLCCPCGPLGLDDCPTVTP